MSPLSSLNYINAGPHGTFKQSGQFATTPADIDALFTYLEQNHVPRLMLYFHGGLVKEAAGMQTAERLTPVIQAAGSHPVSFVWETGLVEILSRNLESIFGSELVKKLLKYVLKQASKRWGIDLEGRGSGAGMTLSEIDAELEREVPFAEVEEADISGGRGGMTLSEGDLEAEKDLIQAELEEDLVDDSSLEELVAQEGDQIPVEQGAAPGTLGDEARGGVEVALAVAKFLVPVVVRVLQRRMHKLDHGLLPTAVEELLRSLGLTNLGKPVWDGMKSAAREMWEANPGPINEDSHVGGYFLDKLTAYQAQHPGLVVDLTGHSAGSIVICSLLAAAQRYPGLKFRKVTFLAPAVTSVMFYDELVSKPERVQDFRMFTMQDSSESKDVLVPVLYTRSLLYLVSGILEDEAAKPLSGLERCSRGLEPYLQEKLLAVHKFLHEQGKNRLVLSPTPAEAPPGLRCASLSHGDFDNDPLTLESLKSFVSA